MSDTTRRKPSPEPADEVSQGVIEPTEGAPAEKSAAQFLAALVESSSDAIVGMTLEAIVRSWNPAAERMFGYRAEEIIGRSIRMIIPEDRRHEEEEFLRRLRRGERIEHYETVRRAKDGRAVEVSLTVSPVRNAAGEIVAASKIAREIGDRKLAERRLKESEERFRDLADNISQLAWMTDGNGWIFWYNRRWFEFTGTTLSEVEGWGWRKVHHPDYVEAVTARFRRAIELGEEWEDTFPLRGRDGSYRWFLSRAVPIRGRDGFVRRWFGTNTDITDRMEMEARLKVADRRKDEFLATLSHELRNPLAPIATDLELLRQSPDPGRARHIIDRLDRQVTYLERLVEDLLDVSRITRGQVELHRVMLDLRAVVETAVETCQPLTLSSGHRLEVELPDTPVRLAADPVRLVQVVSNLLSNAVKFTPRGGRIAIAVEVSDGEVTLSVTDSGSGLDEEMRERAFDLFVQGKGERGVNRGGLGVGLTLVRSLVELHGGRVEAASPGVGLGSRFTVHLPLGSAATEAAALAERTHLEPAPAQLRILIVDDNRDAADALQELLELLGYEAFVAYDGKEALGTAGLTHPDVVLLDLGMPPPDGFEVARRLRREAGGEQLCLVALTGWGQSADLERTRAAGFDHHLVKPVEMGALSEILTGLARRPPEAAN